MAQNSFVPATFNDGIYHSPDVPVWTVASAPASKANFTVPIPDDDKQLPNYSEDPIPSAPDINDLPPDYFDISIVPNSAILHYNEVIPFTEPSKAQVKRKTGGVLSLDPLIDKNPDQLWLYFMTYLNEKPSLLTNVHGYHIEHYVTYERYRTSDGHWHSRPVHRTRTVTDFNFSLDLAHYVAQQWWRVAVIPSKKTIETSEFVSLRDALEQYTRSDKSIKEIVCEKQLVGWNFQELRDKIKSLVYATGYRAHVKVTFPITNKQISARSSSKLSRFSNSTLVRVLCVISCLFLIFGPIYLCLRAAGATRDHIVAHYAMVTPIDTFLQLNSGVITTATISRSRDVYVARVS